MESMLPFMKVVMPMMNAMLTCLETVLTGCGQRATVGESGVSLRGDAAARVSQPHSAMHGEIKYKPAQSLPSYYQESVFFSFSVFGVRGPAMYSTQV